MIDLTRVSILLRALMHGLLLNIGHGIHGVRLLILKHRLQMLLLSDWGQRDIGINRIIILFDVREHF